MKSCKISEENYNYLLNISSTPNKAIDQMRKKVIKSEEFAELLGKINKLEKRVEVVQEFIDKHSGGY